MNKNKWLNIKNQAGITEIYINGDIQSDSANDGFLEKVYGIEDTNIYPLDIKNALKEAENKEVHIHINSFGGNIYAGIAISNMIKNHKGKTIAYIDGIAASVASVIALSCDETVLPMNAYLMIHRAWGVVSGNAGDLERYIEVLNRLDEGIVNSYAEKTVEGITKEQIYEFMKEEKWFTGETAKEVFNVKTSEKLDIFNYVETSNKFRHIPKDILNKIENREAEVKKQEVEKLENMKKEIEITLALGGI